MPGTVALLRHPYDEVRVPFAPLRTNSLIRKRSKPAVAAVGCAGVEAEADLAALKLNESPRLDACEQGNSIVDCSVDWSKDVSARADCMTSDTKDSADTGESCHRQDSQAYQVAPGSCCQEESCYL